MGKDYITKSGVHYSITKVRRKTMGITIDRDGNVDVRIPTWVTITAAKGFADEKDEWINKTLKKQFDKKEKSNLRNWEEIRSDTLPWIRGRGGQLFGQKVYDWSVKMGVTYGKVNVRDTSSRWGSCSAKGNLSFSWKIFIMPEELVDYLVVHELAHRKHMNHSHEFWNEVERYIPDYKKLKKKFADYT